MEKRKTQLQLAREKVQEVINRTNERIEELGKRTNELYRSLTDIQAAFDTIRNVPNEKKLQNEELKKIRLNWKQQAEKIEKDYQNATIKDAGAGAAGAGVGVAVVTFGPTAAMGIATTFGVASTGTAISSLSGAAATNAALAWLGGGALAAGGGGMAAGEAMLALAGPIGWALAGVSLVVSGILFYKSRLEKKRLEKIFTVISNRDAKSYELAIVELNERIARIVDESKKLNDAIEMIKTFGAEYSKMTVAQQYELGAYVNLMTSATQLLINPIKGLQPKYSEQDLDNYLSRKDTLLNDSADNIRKKPKQKEEYNNKRFTGYGYIISIANLLYKIDLDEKDKTIIWKALKNNKQFLKSLGIEKKEFNKEKIEIAIEALHYKYALER